MSFEAEFDGSYHILHNSKADLWQWNPQCKMIIRPVAGQGSLPETRFSFIPNTIQINQRLCNNWYCKDLTQKNSKSVTLTFRSCTEIGMVQHKILDKALLPRHNWIKSIEGFAKKKTDIVKHLSQNIYIKILSLWPSGWEWYHIKFWTSFYQITMPNMNQSIKGFTKTDIVKT